MKLGDHVKKALEKVGITEQRVSEWLGKPCNCRQRQEKLNQLGAWAVRVLRGKTERSEEYLERVIKEQDGQL